MDQKFYEYLEREFEAGGLSLAKLQARVDALVAKWNINHTTRVSTADFDRYVERIKTARRFRTILRVGKKIDERRNI